MNVKIISRQISGGKMSLYLDYSLGRSERVKVSLGMFVAEKPRNAIERDEKSQIMRIAESKRSEAYISLLQGQRPNKNSNVTVGDYAETIKGRRLKKKTKDNWVTLGNHMRASGVGRLPLDRVTVNDAIQFRLYLESSALAKSTASVMYGHFRTLLRTAAQEGILREDITARVGTIGHPKAQIEYLEQDELEALLSTPVKSSAVRQAFAFGCLTGLRYCDIKDLTWDQIRETPTGFAIRRTQQKTGRHVMLPMDPDTLRWTGTRQESGLVFPQIPTEKAMNTTLQRWAERAGIKKHIHFHVSRHTYATLALASGIDLKTVSKMLGHATIKSTEIYAEVLATSLRHAAGAVKTSARPDAPNLYLLKA